MRDDHGPDDESRQPEELKKSKTMRKKEMLELQKLGERLIDLPASYLKKSGIPGELLEAVLAAKKISPSVQERGRGSTSAPSCEKWTPISSGARWTSSDRRQ